MIGPDIVPAFFPPTYLNFEFAQRYRDTRQVVHNSLDLEVGSHYLCWAESPRANQVESVADPHHCADL